ncbi:hypothetical protein C4565_05315 [Candidatus Parcubacteria bacterium]|nr:MAG: hypothetical protein C4565_05315 [Candidatus Parcubacteria bacterium]
MKEAIEYDLILINFNFREVNQYPCIAKHLSKRYRVGFIDVPGEMLSIKMAKTKSKLEKTNQIVTTLISELGADVLDPRGRYRCRLMLLPQSCWMEKKLPVKVDFDICCALERFGSGPLGTKELSKMGVSELWIYDYKLYTAIAGTVLHYKGDKEKLPAIEMGTPYKKYPALDFSDLNIDYLLAYPTSMLLKSGELQFGFYKNIDKVIGKIDYHKIISKQHNVRDQDNRKEKLKNKKIYQNIIDKAPRLAWEGLIKFSEIFKLRGLRHSAYQRQKSMLENTIKKKTVDLESLTQYGSLGIEHFLPFIRKGVITGISSCIWHALYDNIPVYNCDTRVSINGLPNEKALSVFHILPCNGELRFDRSAFEFISESSRKADIINLIEERLLTNK